jgi:hypothetical protein
MEQIDPNGLEDLNKDGKEPFDEVLKYYAEGNISVYYACLMAHAETLQSAISQSIVHKVEIDFDKLKQLLHEKGFSEKLTENLAKSIRFIDDTYLSDHCKE